MNIFRVCLFGHRSFSGHRTLDTKLFELVKNLLCEKEFVEIYVGRNGEFDIYAASIVKRVQKAIGVSNSEFICVLPYKVKDIEYYEQYFDDVTIPECVQKLHPKSAIEKRNKWLVDICDLVICYVERESGGAYCAMEYAQKNNKKVINLAYEEYNCALS